MKNSELSALSRRMQSYFPTSEPKTGLLYLTPVGHVLRGVLFDRCSDKRAVHANVFLQPLFVPVNHVALNLGWRLGGGSRAWNIDNEAELGQLGVLIRDEAFPFLKGIDSIGDIIEAIRSLAYTGDGYWKESLAYALALSGQVREATVILEELLGLFDHEIEWQRQAADRAMLLMSLLSQSAVTAQAQLRSWEDETIRSLGLSAIVH